MIKTHEELIKLHGKKVRCVIAGRSIDDAKISVNPDRGYMVHVCQNLEDGSDAKDKLGYQHSWYISEADSKYEDDRESCENIELIEEDSIDEKAKDLFSEIGKCIDSLIPAVIKTANEKAYKEWNNFLEVHNALKTKAMKLSSAELKKFVKKLGEII